MSQRPTTRHGKTDLLNPDAVTNLGIFLKCVRDGPQNEQDVRLLSLGR
jgi:hypothetical protein